MSNLSLRSTDLHWVKSAVIRSFFDPYFPAFGPNTTQYLSVFSPNAGKYGSEKLQIGALFTQCLF